MNAKKLQLELMRAVLRSSTLEHDDAYRLLRRIFPIVSSEVQKEEQRLEEEKEK